MDQVIHMSLFTTPLDFSTKKPKLHNISAAPMEHDHSDNDDNDNDRSSSHSVDMTNEEDRTSMNTTTAQSPCSQLRNILSMKSPGVNELSSTSPSMDGTALNLTMPQQALEIGRNHVTNTTAARLWSTANSIPISADSIVNIPTSSSKVRRAKRTDSHSLSDDDDIDSSGQSCTSSTSPTSSNNSDCSFGTKTSPQLTSQSQSQAFLSPSTASQLFMSPSTNQLKPHYHQPNILSRPHRQQQQQQSELDTSNLKMSTSPKLARKSSPLSPTSPVQVVTPIATKLSPMHHNFSPYGNLSQASVAVASLSPMFTQAVPTSSFGLPLQFHTSPSLFSTTSSPLIRNDTLLTTYERNSLLSPNTSTQSEAVTTNSSSGGKLKTTRPFKAYPKDPLTFPAVGLYGLPLSAPQPGSTESIIHQQSNNAYAEFRRQMLSQTQGKGSKRLNQSHLEPGPGQQQQQQQQTNLLSPISIPSLTTPLTTAQQMQQIQQLLLASESPTNLSSSADMLNYRLSLIERGTPNGRASLGRSRGGATSSGAEDSHSNFDEGFGSNEKSRIGNGSAKSDQQLKDEAYWERRRKNNEAAKRSRDARRAKEDEIAIRAAFLEQENLKLRFEVCTLKHEIEKLKSMILKR